ncbi:hypothetical protein AVEN_3896-1 [Araneus ventricosus]|uniref:Uncharacterized protein n=1 Tax=Araneus ventricosus TaxID=182803 RepID=A0A4Y2J7R5_ARAVE|nr:hypothetical protein AVEN_3896-1 [Araneus ventricosus]
MRVSLLMRCAEEWSQIRLSNQSYYGALLEYRMPICGRASVGIFAPHQREDVWPPTYGNRPNTRRIFSGIGFEAGTLPLDQRGPRIRWKERVF